MSLESEPVSLPDQIDFQAVATWLSHCQQQHDPKCSTRRYANTAAPDSGGIYLLDISRGSVVPASLDDRFIALSYVWGGVDQLRLLKSKRDALAEPGALQSETFRPRIGQTLRDAVAVVRAMGERYLWIDALCICQDDPEHKRAQIGQMAAIYDAAVLTIVACTAESADSPLPGVQPGTRLLRPNPITEEEALENELMSKSATGLGFLWNFARSPHHGRAWTFQEVILSRRCLFLFGNQVFFQCQQSRREEGNDVDEPNNSMNHQGNWPPLEATFPPPQSRYGEFVHDYTRRRLTFPADRLDAFSGLTTALETAWGWSFAYGLPVQDFSRVLLWAPEDPVACRTKGRETLPLPAEHLFPSWSWLSHPGPCYYFLDRPAGLQSFIDWSATTLWDGHRSQRLLAAGGHQADASRNDLPDDSLADMFEGYPPGTMVIMAWTAGMKALGEAPTNPDMEAFEEKRKTFSVSGSIYTPLVNPEGKWYGTLLGISEAQLRDLLQQEGMELALVLLSTSESTWVMGGFSRPIPCFDFSEYLNEQWCTFNVMLISFGERPYRRLAIGEIHKDEWDKLSPEPDLVWLA